MQAVAAASTASPLRCTVPSSIAPQLHSREIQSLPSRVSRTEGLAHHIISQVPLKFHLGLRSSGHARSTLALIEDCAQMLIERYRGLWDDENIDTVNFHVYSK